MRMQALTHVNPAVIIRKTHTSCTGHTQKVYAAAKVS